MKNARINVEALKLRFEAIQAQKVLAETSANWPAYNQLIDEEKKIVKALNLYSPMWRDTLSR